MTKKQIMGILRHVLTFVGGLVVAKGLATDALMMELTGATVTLVGGLWSILDKIKTDKES